MPDPPRPAEPSLRLPEGWDIEQEPDGVFLLRRGATLSAEEWRVGPDLLEIRRTTLGFGRTARYTGARLEINRGGGGGMAGFSVHVVQQGRKHYLDAQQYEQDIRILGLFLADITGWPLTTAS